jgi:hypothetical protein
MQIKHKVTATIKDKSGKVIHTQEGENAVTTGDPTSVHNGFVWLLDRAFGDGTYFDPDDNINKMMLGTGTPSNSGLGTPKTGVPGTTLLAFKSGSPTWDVSTLTAPVITATCDWDSSFDALSGITEAGLFVDGTDYEMIAYKTFSPALSKTTGGTLTIEWEITMS